MFVRQIPVIGQVATRLYRLVRRQSMPSFRGSSARFWEHVYQTGGNSGDGSYGPLAAFKAEILNRFVAELGVNSVIEFGCGDGHQLTLMQYPSYRGFDVSDTAISWCQKRFRDDATKEFRTLREYSGEKADLALSLDVIYHLIEDSVFQAHVSTLFAASTRYVAIYSSNFDGASVSESGHVRHRRFTDWVDGNIRSWRLLRHVPNRYP